MNISGVAILRSSGQDRAGNTIETCHLIYVTDTSNRLFLSKKACTMLGMINDKFPTIGEISPDLHIKDSKVTTYCHTISDIDHQPASAWECPKCTAPPQHPRNHQSELPRKTVSNSKSTWLTTTDPVSATHVNTNHYPLCKANP